MAPQNKNSRREKAEESCGSPRNYVPYEGDIVIAGISGRYPESENVGEFRDNLMNKVNMITSDSRRWEVGHLGLPLVAGKLKTVNRFDAEFFNLNSKQTEMTDPQNRMLLEVAYEAVVDAGMDEFIIFKIYRSSNKLGNKQRNREGTGSSGDGVYQKSYGDIMDRAKSDRSVLREANLERSLIKTIRQRQLQVLGHICRDKSLEYLVNTGESLSSIKGTRTGVYVAIASSEAESAWAIKKDPYIVMGCPHTMSPNRVSYFFDIHGPSVAYDTACSSSLVSLEAAMSHMRNGVIDSAIVAGLNICFRALTSKIYQSMGMLGQEACKTFDASGPSVAYDTACSSSLVSLEAAMSHMRNGVIDSAIVAGLNICFRALTSKIYQSMGMLGQDACKTFDASGDGFVRGEIISAIFLKKAVDSKRIYCSIVDCLTNNDGFTPQGLTYPNGEAQEQLMREVYAHCKVSPQEVTYFECHGTGTPAGDPQESNAISRVMCPKERNGPLLVGSVKSNMGHGETGSGHASITKVVLAMHEGVIPPNLHFRTPNPKIEGLLDGRMAVVTEPTPWLGGYIAINSFGMGGSNAHILFKSPDIPRRELHPSSNKPRLFTYCARTEQGLRAILAEAHKHSSNVEFHALCQESANMPLGSMPYRGATILNGQQKFEVVEKCTSRAREVWFVYAGMGSQWVGMARSLLELEVFRKSIESSAKILKPLGVDLIHILKEGTEEILRTIINPFVCITSIQLALTDLLTAMGIRPDGIVGHSMGEVGCAYADGCLTAEEAVLTAYWRGKCVTDGKIPPGKMAAVGLTWEEAKAQCPPGVVPACHNADDSVTISGSSEATLKFMAELKAKDVFVREVNSSNIAYHSYFMNDIHDSLRDALSKVITPKPRTDRWVPTSVPEESWDTPQARSSSAEFHANNLISPVLFCEALKKVITPKPRTDRWVPTSVPEESWDTPQARSSSAEFHANNLISPVLFCEALKKVRYGEFENHSKLTGAGRIPPTAIVIELAPHGLLQSVIKRTVGSDSISVGLQKRNYPDNLEFFLASLGKCFAHGLSMNSLAVFPPVQFPVPRGTPRLADMITNAWDHSAEWLVPTTEDFEGRVQGSSSDMSFTIDVSEDSPDRYLIDHQVDGRELFPACGCLVLAWKALASLRGKEFDQMPARLTNVEIHQAMFLRKSGAATVTVSVMPWSGEFQVCENENLLASGYVTSPDSDFLETTQHTKTSTLKDWPKTLVMTQNEVYKELILRGYEYGKYFQGIVRASVDGEQTDIAWDGRWISFMDAVLQMTILARPGDFQMLPIKFLSINIDPRVHPHPPLEDAEPVIIPGRYDPVLNIVACGGVEIRGAQTIMAPRRLTHAPETVEEYRFVPYHVTQDGQGSTGAAADLREYADACLIFAQQGIKRWLAQDKSNVPPHRQLLQDAVRLAENNAIKSSSAMDFSTAKTKLDVILKNQNGQKRETYPIVAALEVASDNPKAATDRDRILGRYYSETQWRKFFQRHGLLEVIHRSDDLLSSVFLLKKRVEIVTSPIIVCMDDLQCSWLEEVKAKYAELEHAPEDARLWLVGTSDCNGMLGFYNCLRLEPGSERVRCVQISNLKSGSRLPSLTPDSEEFKRIKEKDLAFNIYRDGVWGTYRHLAITDEQRRQKHPTAHAFADSLAPGDLSALTWVSSPLNINPLPEKERDAELCAVYFAGVNPRDILLATAKLRRDDLPDGMFFKESVLGIEFSGRDTKGKRVMGLCSPPAMSTTVLCARSCLWSVPQHWSLEEAATVPVAYGTAYYALVVRGHLRQGDTVLIHHGGSDIGQAAIAIALSCGCEVFTTTATKEETAQIRASFPRLKDRNFCQAHDVSFERHIKRETKGKGVDIVLNSETGELLKASVRLLAKRGRFLNLAPGTELDAQLALSRSGRKDTSFHDINLDTLIDSQDAEWTELTSLVQTGIQSGVVKPLRRTVYGMDKLTEVFRLMADGRNADQGKVLIKIREQEAEKIILPPRKMFDAIPRTFFHPSKSYIIVGGLGGFGLELSHWMVLRGARKLVLSSRNGITSGYQNRKITFLRGLGADVSVAAINVTSQETAESLVKIATNMAPLGGLFNLGLNLRDALLVEQTAENYRQTLESKIQTTRLLDEISREENVRATLDHFVVFSSLSAGHGIPGQTNYGWGNSYMDRLCEKRKSLGLPALSIQWASIADVGFVGAKGNNVVIEGKWPQRMYNCLNVVDYFMTQDRPVVACHVLAEKVKAAEQGEESIIEQVTRSVGNVLGLKSVSAVDPDKSFLDLGLDSLMSVEIKQMMERDLEVNLSTKEIQMMTFAQLQTLAKV
ncbi:fatty acid synthase [Plakobranchus ocellatus]|uniref:Fatty acid synthase n=1 Tax=Plakobranchus ocellatus TaxID=259542 RepID=A0AAV4AK28_9GAST|nr:fatty acid synthase [Plakobranchus ocellatus]